MSMSKQSFSSLFVKNALFFHIKTTATHEPEDIYYACCVTLSKIHTSHHKSIPEILSVMICIKYTFIQNIMIEFYIFPLRSIPFLYILLLLLLTSLLFFFFFRLGELIIITVIRIMIDALAPTDFAFYTLKISLTQNLLMSARPGSFHIPRRHKMYI